MYSKNLINLRFQSINSIDCSPSGNQIVCASNKNIRVFDQISQKLVIKSCKVHNDNIASIRYSPNGHSIASGSFDYTIKMWNASSLIQIGKTMRGHIGAVQSIAFSPDNLYLVSGSRDRTIRIWSCNNQQQVCESVEYSPNGLEILSAGTFGKIRIWDSSTAQRLRKLIAPKCCVYSAKYSLDGRLIVSCSQEIKVWNTTIGQQMYDDLIGHNDDIRSVALSQDCSLIISGSDDKTFRLWNLLAVEKEIILHTHGDQVNTVGFSKDGRYALSGSSDNTISIIKIMKLGS